MYTRISALRKSIIPKRRYGRLFETASEGIIILDAADGTVRAANPFLLEISGYAAEEMLGRKLWETGACAYPGKARVFFQELLARGRVRYEDLLKKKNGSDIPVEFIGNVFVLNLEKMVQYNVRDVSLHWKEMQEREKEIAQLRAALEKISRLTGMLPMCASCKSIRDDGGQWQPVEQYLCEHSDANFTHGICPECMKKLYPQFSRSTQHLRA